jgi:hypothetical protein
MKHFLALGEMPVGQLRHALYREDNEEPLVFRSATLPQPAWTERPQVRPIVFQLMSATEAVHLGIVEAWWLMAGRGIKWPDVKTYVVVVQALPGATIRIADEEISLSPGQVFRMDGHEAACFNGSSDAAILLMVSMEHE